MLVLEGIDLDNLLVGEDNECALLTRFRTAHDIDEMLLFARHVESLILLTLRCFGLVKDQLAGRQQ